MLITHTVDMATVPAAERFGFWHDLVAREAAPQRITSAHAADFDAWFQLIELGHLRLTSFRYPSLDTRRTALLIRRGDPETYQLALPMTGHSAISQDRRESALQPADFTLLDSSRPHEASHTTGPSGQQASSLTVIVPRAVLPVPPDRVGRLCAARLPSSTGMGALLARFLVQLATHPEQYRPADAAFLGNTALDLIAATVAQQLDLDSALPADMRQRALRARIDAFIDEHLGDADLDPRTVAAAHHISVRTLHRLFAGQDPVAEVIRARRLHRCRQDLVNPLLRGQPVHAVAARWGFRDQAHFSRLFKARYGLPPQAYRSRGG